eukprot:m.317376 g.317376  ORF g.317376 m.317376 type:complete len:171 (-) comp20284_c0_seq73:5174-5686(-)
MALFDYILPLLDHEQSEIPNRIPDSFESLSCEQLVQSDFDHEAGQILSDADVRLVVFAQSRHQRRAPLFDSATLERKRGSSAPASTTSQDASRTNVKHTKDVKEIGDIVFGCVPSAFRGTTTKFHTVSVSFKIVASCLLGVGLVFGDLAPRVHVFQRPLMFSAVVDALYT